MSRLKENFGTFVFGDSIMREKLPKDIYRSLKQTIAEGKDLDSNLANVVANAMKTWAIENGATHYTHWFQPLSGVTAEKHDAFLVAQGDGTAIETFSGKNLIKGEPDASSFPSGGLRATFEARGYTAWDPTSYAFIKDHTLCIPTVFCSYGGEVLDKKTPLLRATEALELQAGKVLALLGKPCGRVTCQVGAEQEYFLIDKSLWEKREDLRLCGRTLFGAPAPKGQELEDHYFGVIRPRVKAFMEELDEELWKLGIYACTEHNEVAPCQHELAPGYTLVNMAADQNQLTMEIMKKVADRHGLVCLLHEKPFAGVNGSGKHNNWSLAADGENLLKPGDQPFENTCFLLFLSAVITAVDEYQDLLRIAAASPQNDLRLGGNEAPPAIVSVYLGDELTGVLEAIEQGKKYIPARRQSMQTGVHVLPDFRKDTTDRNRTSPMAFTGNKFEFRMLGSGQSISDLNMVLNTAVASVLAGYAAKLKGKKEPEAAARRLVRDAYAAHKRIIFNGNNYSEEWVKEAERRGLMRLSSAADAIPHLTDAKNLSLFTEMGIFTETELHSRRDIMLENYCKVLRIEARTMLDMTRRYFLPAVIRYSTELAAATSSKEQIRITCCAEKKLTPVLVADALDIDEAATRMELLLQELSEGASASLAALYREELVPAMAYLREQVDRAELHTAADRWPVPDYAELLFYVE